MIDGKPSVLAYAGREWQLGMGVTREGKITAYFHSVTGNEAYLIFQRHVFSDAPRLWSVNLNLEVRRPGPLQGFEGFGFNFKSVTLQLYELTLDELFESLDSELTSLGFPLTRESKLVFEPEMKDLIDG